MQVKQDTYVIKHEGTLIEVLKKQKLMPEDAVDELLVPNVGTVDPICDITRVSHIGSKPEETCAFFLQLFETFIEDFERGANNRDIYFQGVFDGTLGGLSGIDWFVFSRTQELQNVISNAKSKEEREAATSALQEFQSKWSCQHGVRLTPKEFWFAYIDDEGKPSACCFCVFPGNPQDWMLFITQNTLAPLRIKDQDSNGADDSTVSRAISFTSGQMAYPGQATGVIINDGIKPNIRAALNSLKVATLLEDLIDANFQVNMNVFEKIKNRLKFLTFDNRDIKTYLLEALFKIGEEFKESLGEEIQSFLEIKQEALDNPDFFEDEHFQVTIQKIITTFLSRNNQNLSTAISSYQRLWLYYQLCIGYNGNSSNFVETFKDCLHNLPPETKRQFQLIAKVLGNRSDNIALWSLMEICLKGDEEATREFVLTHANSFPTNLILALYKIKIEALSTEDVIKCLENCKETKNKTGYQLFLTALSKRPDSADHLKNSKYKKDIERQLNNISVLSVIPSDEPYLSTKVPDIHLRTALFLVHKANTNYHLKTLLNLKLKRPGQILKKAPETFKQEFEYRTMPTHTLIKGGEESLQGEELDPLCGLYLTEIIGRLLLKEWYQSSDLEAQLFDPGNTNEARIKLQDAINNQLADQCRLFGELAIMLDPQDKPFQFPDALPADTSPNEKVAIYQEILIGFINNRKFLEALKSKRSEFSSVSTQKKFDLVINAIPLDPGNINLWRLMLRLMKNDISVSSTDSRSKSKSDSEDSFPNSEDSHDAESETETSAEFIDDAEPEDVESLLTELHSTRSLVNSLDALKKRGYRHQYAITIQALAQRPDDDVEAALKNSPRKETIQRELTKASTPILHDTDLRVREFLTYKAAHDSKISPYIRLPIDNLLYQAPETLKQELGYRATPNVDLITAAKQNPTAEKMAPILDELIGRLFLEKEFHQSTDIETQLYGDGESPLNKEDATVALCQAINARLRAQCQLLQDLAKKVNEPELAECFTSALHVNERSESLRTVMDNYKTSLTKFINKINQPARLEKLKTPSNRGWKIFASAVIGLLCIVCPIVLIPVGYFSYKTFTTKGTIDFINCSQGQELLHAVGLFKSKLGMLNDPLANVQPQRELNIQENQVASAPVAGRMSSPGIS